MALRRFESARPARQPAVAPAVTSARPGRSGGGLLALQRRAGNHRVQRLVAAQRPGRSLPVGLRSTMERAFGADLSDVRVHEGPQAGAVDAVAYTRGSDIHFGPGEYQPHTAYGQALLGHELTHVLQQRAGRVAGGGVDPDARLEREAHETGTAAARGEAVHLPGAATTPAGPVAEGGAPVQRTPKKLKRILRYLGLMNQPGGGGGAGAVAPAAAGGADLDDFVAAYDNARYYHGTEEQANARSIHDHGLLTHTDRAATLGGEVNGMSATRRDFHGDEKRGVYFGDRYFMEDEDVTIPKNRVRLFMSHDRMDHVLPPTRIHNAPADAIVRDPNWGGALISKSSIPADRTYYGDMMDLAANPDDRLTSILSAVASYYPEGQAPSEAQMTALLREAIRARRLSGNAMDVGPRGLRPAAPRKRNA